MKVAIVCSWLNQYGGAERVLESLHDLYPGAPIYTSMFLPEAMPRAYREWDIRTSFLDRLPFVKRHHQAFLPLYPLAFEQFDLGEYDVVISNSSAFCLGVITPPGTTHVCYCLTPARFLWDYKQYIQGEKVGKVARALLPVFLNYLRTWDTCASSRVDHFVAISRAVAARVAKCYRRDSVVIHPPIEADSFSPSDDVDDYYLIISRLVPYKRIDLAIQAFNHLALPLRIVGDGRHRERLEKLARPNVQFLGRVSDGAIKELYARCRALIFPGEEDFGLSPLEAMASGRPVIAYAAGGAMETIVEGVTGAFFRQPTVDALVRAVEAFDHRAFDPMRTRRHAEGFDVRVFKRQLGAYVAEKWREHEAASGGLGKVPISELCSG
ncbi:MAG: glycosyltransferase [Chloroflexi bacterium]|nr:glycosyltransferase [Chloroflexota bacterium]